MLANKCPSVDSIEDVWRLVATFNMLIADNKDIAHMMLDYGFATIMTKLFKAVFQAEIKASNSFSKNKHLIRATFYFTHFFIICTHNKVLVGLSFPELVNFLEAIFKQGDFADLCTEDFFNSTNLGAGTGG